MRAVTFRHSWSSNQTEEQEMIEKFGELLVDEDTSEAYEIDASKLFFNGEEYTWIDANGCSCWDGDWDGWALTAEELITLAEKTAREVRYGESSEENVANWILDNIK